MRPMVFNGTLLGGRGVGINLAEAAYADTETYPDAAESGFQLSSDGTAAADVSSVPNWLVGSTNGAAYECRATIVSGTPTSGTTGSWLNLGTNRSWSVSRSSLGTKSFVFDLEVGPAGANSALKTARITLSATVAA